MFNVVSISVSTSSNSFLSNFDLSTVLSNVFFTRPTFLSNCLPHQVAWIRLNFHLIHLVLKRWWRISDLLIFLIHLKVFALSEYIVSGRPLLAINLLNALMNSYVVWSGCISKWIALIKLHVKRLSTPFSFLYFCCDT